MNPRQDAGKRNGLVANGVPGPIASDRSADGVVSHGKGKTPSDDIIGTGKFVCFWSVGLPQPKHAKTDRIITKKRPIKELLLERTNHNLVSLRVPKGFRVKPMVVKSCHLRFQQRVQNWKRQRRL